MKAWVAIFGFLLFPALAGAETLTVSGQGTSAVEAGPKKQAAQANQAALARAEEQAVRDALETAIASAYGTRERLGSQGSDVVARVSAHSAALIRERQVTRADVATGTAFVEVILKVDGKALRDYLQDSLGLSLTQDVEGRFRVFVFAYTTEGQDVDRAKAPVLREEVTDNRTNVQHGKEASSGTATSAQSEALSVKAAASMSDNGSLQGRSEARAGVKENVAVDSVGKASGSADARASQSESAAWDQKAAASLDARASAEKRSYEQNSNASQHFSDTSTQYHKLVIYADTTKRGAGITNEARAKLGEILRASGFVTAFADVNLMGRSFANEDELYQTVLKELRSKPEAQSQDYVAVALNRLTPILGARVRFTSQMTYRVVRLGDGNLLLPDKVVAADSGDQTSDDLARTVATELAIKKVDDVLPREIALALKQLGREGQRQAAADATTYSIRIDNVSNPGATRAIKDALRSGGFTVDPQFRGEAKTESIAVSLNGRRGDDVMALLERQLSGFDVLSMDSRATVLRMR